MRGDIICEWLSAFYKHIGKQRPLLLLMDNFSAHLSALDYTPPPSNIKVLFFPANATSVLSAIIPRNHPEFKAPLSEEMDNMDD